MKRTAGSVRIDMLIVCHESAGIATDKAGLDPVGVWASVRPAEIRQIYQACVTPTLDSASTIRVDPYEEKDKLKTLTSVQWASLITILSSLRTVATRTLGSAGTPQRRFKDSITTWYTLPRLLDEAGAGKGRTPGIAGEVAKEPLLSGIVGEDEGRPAPNFGGNGPTASYTVGAHIMRVDKGT